MGISGHQQTNHMYKAFPPSGVSHRRMQNARREHTTISKTNKPYSQWQPAVGITEYGLWQRDVSYRCSNIDSASKKNLLLIYNICRCLHLFWIICCNVAMDLHNAKYISTACMMRAIPRFLFNGAALLAFPQIADTNRTSGNPAKRNSS